MAKLTTDPDDPRLGHGFDLGPTPQHDVYLVLPEEEINRGFVRPLRRSYTHVGPPGPTHPLRDLTTEERERYGDRYAKYEEYPEGSRALGRLWSQAELDAVGKGCGTSTRMAYELCATYARNPRFYAATYCVGCGRHLPVQEFIWDEDGERVGS